VVERSEQLEGTIAVPGDKSISHRAAVVAGLADGSSLIRGMSAAADCESTLSCLEALGVRVRRGTGPGDPISIEGRGKSGFRQPDRELDAGNSGTTMRLLAGALAPHPITVRITGDESLRRRPMRRIIEPLTMMGANVTAGDDEGHAPLTVDGGPLSGIEYSMPVASAQVKSSILLAALGASGPTTIVERVRTRDHTERMLKRAGVGVEVRGLSVKVEPGTPLAMQLDVPGDFSSAAFLMVAALLCPGSRVAIRSVGLNPTRIGFLNILRRMEAPVSIALEGVDSWEPRGDLVARSGSLLPIDVDAEDVALAIDEIPLVALLATQAEGRTVISGAAELRLKESDRIGGTVAGLRAMGGDVRETEDGMVIEGPCRLRGAVVSSARDHRIAMMLALAGMIADGRTMIGDWEWTDISYPGFAEVLEGIGGRISRI
jgi:3-phosphoshikimate 1-carboxyvinyltransferase